MEPLRVTARLRGALVNPANRVALDALLAAAVAIRDELPPVRCAEDLTPVEIPLALSACGRFYLASLSHQLVEERQLTHMAKPTIIRDFIDHCGPKGTIQIGAGINKAWRIPMELGHLERDELAWWCIGDADGIRALLALVHHIGKKRAHGRGEVAEWRVEPCESWGDGFPVLRDGVPQRPLPRHHEGVASGSPARAALRPPYWMRELYEEVVQ